MEKYFKESDFPSAIASFSGEQEFGDRYGIDLRAMVAKEANEKVQPLLEELRVLRSFFNQVSDTCAEIRVLKVMSERMIT